MQAVMLFADRCAVRVLGAEGGGYVPLHKLTSIFICLS